MGIDFFRLLLLRKSHIKNTTSSFYFEFPAPFLLTDHNENKTFQLFQGKKFPYFLRKAAKVIIRESFRLPDSS